MNKGPIAILVASFAACGCASTQLNYNTLDLASTTAGLQTRQVAYNLGKFVESEDAIPSQLVISYGSAATTDTISPTVSGPFDAVVTVTHALTNSTSKTRNPVSASLTGTDAWTQNWGYAPVTDPNQLRRLRALYLYAVDNDEAAFIRRYPVVTKSVAESRPVCEVPITKFTTDTTSEKNERGEYKSVGKLYQSCVPLSNASDTTTVQIPDEYHLKRPRCVVCLRNERIGYTVGNLMVNENLRGGWLRWRGPIGARGFDREPGPDDISLGTYGAYELFVTRGQMDRFAEFVLAVDSASTVSDGAAASSSGSAGAKAGSGKGSATLIQLEGGIVIAQ